MNNKGQTLVMFVIILPIVLLILAFVIDLGILYVYKRNISNNVCDSVEYYLSNLDDKEIETKTKNLLEKNIDDVEIEIKDDDKYIEITVEKEYKRLFGVISNNEEINIKYIGNKLNKEIIKG